MTEKQMKVGSKVSYRSNQDCEDEDEDGSVEVGVVVHLCMSDNGCDQDAYVAFFGESFPVGAPKEKPYILRYYVSALQLLDA